MVSDVTKTSAKVKWEKPEDDGGVPIKEYEIEKMDTKTGKWVRVGKIPGDALDTEFNVSGLNPGSEYKFRVTAINDEGDSEPLTSERGVVAKNPFGNSKLEKYSLPCFCPPLMMAVNMTNEISNFRVILTAR